MPPASALGSRRTLEITGSSVDPGSYFVFGGVLESVKPAYVDYAYGADLGDLRNNGGRISLECNDVKVDRVACPWLISRFVDQEAEWAAYRARRRAERAGGAYIASLSFSPPDISSCFSLRMARFMARWYF